MKLNAEVIFLQLISSKKVLGKKNVHWSRDQTIDITDRNHCQTGFLVYIATSYHVWFQLCEREYELPIPNLQPFKISGIARGMLGKCYYKY